MSTREMRVHLRQMVMSLLLASLDHPAPNLTHLLCGFDIKRAIQKTSLQDPGKHLLCTCNVLNLSVYLILMDFEDLYKP